MFGRDIHSGEKKIAEKDLFEETKRITSNLSLYSISLNVEVL